MIRASNYPIAIIILILTINSCGDRLIGPDDGIELFGIKATSIGLEVIVGWDTIDDPNLTGYKIYRQNEDNGFKSIDSVGSEQNSYSDFTVTQEIRYEYKVTAKLTNNMESEPSEIVTIIPGLTTTWVYDFSSNSLIELSHDAAHKTGKTFGSMPLVTSFDIDDKNGYIYLLNGSSKTLMQYVEDFEPGTLINSDSMDVLFDDPSDLKYDSIRDEMWIADGSSGNIYHYVERDSGGWVRNDSLNTGGSADEGQIALNSGDYWVVNNVGKSVDIFQKRGSGYIKISVGGFTSGGILLALDLNINRAYAIDRGTGAVYRITALGEKDKIADVNKVLAAAVYMDTGDLWLLADDDGNGIYDLIKLSVTGGRILAIDTGFSDPTWMGVNSLNGNVVVLNVAVEEARVATFDKSGNSINSYETLSFPVEARILKLN